MTLQDLTARQQEVATLVGIGLKYSTIAKRLGMKPETVRAHVNDITEEAELTDTTIPAYRRVMVWVLEQRRAA